MNTNCSSASPLKGFLRLTRPARLLFLLAALCPGVAGAQALTSGGNQAGTITMSHTSDSWTFTASTGDTILLRLGTTGFNGSLSLYSPSSALLATALNATDLHITYTATNSGTFTVVVGPFSAGGTGTYVLHYLRIPGAFIVPSGDDGGPLTSGGNHPGNIDLADLDPWTFTANTGDSILLRLGTTSFNGSLSLYGTDGSLLASAINATDLRITYTATNSGTFTVVVSSYPAADTGSYVLHYLKIPGGFIVPSGDDGGPLTNGGNHPGNIDLADLDPWTFTANTGDSILLRLGTTSFNGSLSLYGTDGSLLASAINGTDLQIAYTATNSGTFTVVVSSYTTAGTGTYVLHYLKMPGGFIVPAGDDGGPLTSGGNHPGSIDLADLDPWTFTANTGDTVLLRLGTTGFNGKLSLYGTDGTLQASTLNSTDLQITYTATNSGTFTVVVSSYTTAGTGSYVLHYLKIPGGFIVPAGDDGGALTSGGNHPGTIDLADLDPWTFTANTGDTVLLRLGTTGFNGKLSLYGTDGTLQASTLNSTDLQITYTATNSGTFTVVVSSFTTAGTGSYVLHYLKIPGGFIVPAGDDGGALTNGGNHPGAIDLADLDPWTFTANTGNTILLRLGTTGFNGSLSLYGPDGALLATDINRTDLRIAYSTTNSGTFTVVVSSYPIAGTGNYVLHYYQIPGGFIVPAGDQGGAMSGSPSYSGNIDLADQDLWTFTACRGDHIVLQLNTTNFNGLLYLYGANGALLRSAINSTSLNITYQATNCGPFSVLVASYPDDGTGTYRLAVNGLSDAMKLCIPTISGTNLDLSGIGGPSNATFVLFSATNVTTPLPQWTPITTNAFDQFGVFFYTNRYDPAQRQQVLPVADTVKP